MEKITSRRLAAIVSADVAGYSRLMSRDEEGTLTALKSHRADLIDPQIEEHNGRIVKTTGDGLLAEFASVVDALLCCLNVQRQMLVRNRTIPINRQIQFRIGINIGDIIVDGDDIFGDGVNVAARLEAIAAPGGICVARSVLEQIRNKMPLEVEDLGERALKNIDVPVHAYQVLSGERSPEGKTAEDDAAEVFLPQRPEIAILPFRNINHDTENDFIAEGIGLGIQTLMVQLSGLFLINASADVAYREGRKTAAEVVHELPIRYTLEGAAQRAGERVRVSVQLTDQINNSVVWAEKYDRDLEDVFALQDDITREVISSLNVQLYGQGFAQLVTEELVGNGSWEYFLRGVSYWYKLNKDDNELARQMFEKLYELNPDRSDGPSYIALTHWIDATRGWSASPEISLAKAGDWAEKSVQYKINNGLGHVVMGYIRLQEGKHQEALLLCETAIEQRANCPAALGQIATVKLYCGDADGAVKSAREALAVRAMYAPLLVNILAMAYRDRGDMGLAISTATEAAKLDPSQVDPLVTLCSGHVLNGNSGQARQVANDIVSTDPAFRVPDLDAKNPYRDEHRLTTIKEALREAGLPD